MTDRADDRSMVLFGVYKIQLEILNDKYNHRVEHAADVACEPIDPKIDHLLAASNSVTWQMLYEAEQRLSEFLPENEIVAEAARRFVEAEALGVRSATTLQALFEKSATLADRKATFQRLLDDLHFRYEKRRLDRQVRRETAKRLNSLGILLVAPVALLLALMAWQRSAEPAAQYHVLAVMWFGLMGAYLSRMIAFQTMLSTIDYDALVTGFSNWSVAVRLIIGVLGSLIMYLLISGNLIGGDLFPPSDFKALLRSVALTDGGSSTAVFPATDFAKLLIWSTLAGFTERLLPDQFTRLEGVAKDPKSK
jgi:hypothetical protein